MLSPETWYDPAPPGPAAGAGVEARAYQAEESSLTIDAGEARERRRSHRGRRRPAAKHALAVGGAAWREASIVSGGGDETRRRQKGQGLLVGVAGHLGLHLVPKLTVLDQVQQIARLWAQVDR